MENKTSLLLIDDDPALLIGLEGILKHEGYTVFTAKHGNIGIETAREKIPDLIVCDLMMPPPNGFDVLTSLNHDPKTSNIPFIFLTARAAETDKVQGLLSGADDYIIKPFLKEEFLARVKAVLRRKHKVMAELKGTSEQEVNELRSKIKEILQTSEVNWEKFIDSLVHMLALRDNETEEHTRRVLELAEQTAMALNITGESLLHIRWGSILHDIGKVGIPDSILLKPGSLTNEERAIMMLHPHIAHQILVPLGLPSATLEIPLHHHERWDGKGYPGHLAGENIPLSARIFAVADVWDGLVSDRPYHKAWTQEEALEYVLEQSGKHFDPKIVDVFIKKVLRFATK